MDTAARFDRQRHDVIDVALHQPREAVADADDVDALEPRANRGGGDDAVDAGSGTAADENRKLVRCSTGVLTRK